MWASAPRQHGGQHEHRRLLARAQRRGNLDDLRNNHGALAAFMLGLVDRSPHKLAIVEIPKYSVTTNRQTTQTERWVSREVDRAKQDRPHLGFKLAPATPDYPNAALLVAVHEHEWVGGECVRGCGDRWEDEERLSPPELT